MDVWVDRWMDGWDETGGAFSFLNRHFLTTLKTKFKHKTADFSGGPVVKSPSANAGTQLPSLVQENSTHLGPTRPMSHNDQSPRTKRLCAYTGEATRVRSPWATALQQPAHNNRDLAEPRLTQRKTRIASRILHSLQMEGLSRPLHRASRSAPFFEHHAHSVCLSHTLVILTGFQTSSRWLYEEWPL